MKIQLTVNGQPHSADVEDRTLLVDLLRDTLRLTGTHVGCDTSQCGCCTVHVDGQAVKSCTMLAAQADVLALQLELGLGLMSFLHVPLLLRWLPLRRLLRRLRLKEEHTYLPPNCLALLPRHRNRIWRTLVALYL